MFDAVGQPVDRRSDSIVAMQMIERPWGVAVYGAASVKALPDLVRIRFNVIRLEQAPSAAFEAASHAVGAVRGVLRGQGIPDAAVEGSRLDLKTMWAFPGGTRTFVGYQCQAAFAVESTDLDSVQPLLVNLVAAGANEIEAVEFDVLAKRKLRGEARRNAVAAAREKAELYAEAAGVRLGAIVHIDDVDPDQVGVERYRGHSSVPGVASDQDFAPGHVVVSAAVTIGFALTRD
jgi:uncharacterized protein YggE